MKATLGLLPGQGEAPAKQLKESRVTINVNFPIGECPQKQMRRSGCE